MLQELCEWHYIIFFLIQNKNITSINRKYKERFIKLYCIILLYNMLLHRSLSDKFAKFNVIFYLNMNKKNMWSNSMSKSIKLR